MFSGQCKRILGESRLSSQGRSYLLFSKHRLDFVHSLSNCGILKDTKSFKQLQDCLLPLRKQLLALACVLQFVGVLSCALRGCGFDSWWGHVPGLQVPSPVRGHMGGNQSMFLSHINVSLPPPPSSLKVIKKCPWVRIKKTQLLDLVTIKMFLILLLLF